MIRNFVQNLVAGIHPFPAMSGVGARSSYLPGSFDNFPAGSGNSQTDPLQTSSMPGGAVETRRLMRKLECCDSGDDQGRTEVTRERRGIAEIGDADHERSRRADASPNRVGRANGNIALRQPQEGTAHGHAGGRHREPEDMGAWHLGNLQTDRPPDLEETCQYEIDPAHRASFAIVLHLADINTIVLEKRKPKRCPVGRQRTIDREHVLDIAEQIVTAHGAPALTIGAVAKAAGITKGGVQSCFGTKEALIAAMLERWMEDYDRRSSLFSGDDKKPLARLSAHIAATRTDKSEAQARAAGLLAVLLQQPQHLAGVQNWYRKQMLGLQEGDDTTRRAKIAFFATEGIFLLRFFGLMAVSDREWDALFNDIKKMTGID